MKIKETKILQSQRLKEICNKKDVNYDSLEILLDSVKTKKLLKRNNYHQQKINDVIEKTIK
ncbi:DNA modification system-associated small protein [Psychroserpens algicola]|uniref:DNA modification system-associated small protein n=1 Tax=Psychroserpens algicola TaxID=1719034 RepID=UPI0030B8AA53